MTLRVAQFFLKIAHLSFSMGPRGPALTVSVPDYGSWNQFNDQLLVGLLAQVVRALHRYRRGQGSNPGKPDLFQAFFSQLHKLR